MGNALNLGLTPQQVIEVMIHASWYGGVPTAFNAMGVAKEVFDGLGIEFEPQLVFDPSETPDDLYRRGAARREELMGPPPSSVQEGGRPGPVTQAERDFNRLSTEYYWGSVWNRPGLELAERSICTLACLTVLGREGPLRSHINGALHVGLTPEEIVEVFIHTTFYGGIPFTRRRHRRCQRDFSGQGGWDNRWGFFLPGEAGEGRGPSPARFCEWLFEARQKLWNCSRSWEISASTGPCFPQRPMGYPEPADEHSPALRTLSFRRFRSTRPAAAASTPMRLSKSVG